MPKRLPLLARAFSHVEKTESCWLWTGILSHNGYGRFKVRNDYVGAHRWFYERFVGPIPTGYQIDHLCRVRACVNPEHLEAVTQTENIRRQAEACGGLFGDRVAQQRAATHCLNGHPYTPENTRWYDGHRHCRTCRNEQNRSRRKRLKAAA